MALGVFLTVVNLEAVIIEDRHNPSSQTHINERNPLIPRIQHPMAVMELPREEVQPAGVGGHNFWRESLLRARGQVRHRAEQREALVVVWAEPAEIHVLRVDRQRRAVFRQQQCRLFPYPRPG